MNKNAFLLLVGIASVPVGCTMAPKYTRPAAPVPAEWPSGAAYAESRAATDALEAPDLRWQEFISDERLQQIIETALRNNRDLRLAALNVERARAVYGIQRAELWPSVNATGSGSKQRLTADLSGATPPKRVTVERYDANLGVASWEIDFFGRIRSLKDRALEGYLATEQARRSAQILLVSAVANTYLSLAADRENLTLAETTFEAQKGAYDLVPKRRTTGSGFAQPVSSANACMITLPVPPSNGCIPNKVSSRRVSNNWRTTSRVFRSPPFRQSGNHPATR